jgi:hypothetical protein
MPDRRVEGPSTSEGRHMSMNGIWVIELLTPFGWESMGTAFLEDGRYRAASAERYSIGSYRVEGDAVTVESATHVHGSAQILFGRQDTEYRTIFEGRLVNDSVDGHARATDGDLLMRFRAVKVADLP